jgi:hypothetical protein
MFVVSLALTPVELTVVCVYSEEAIDEYGQINFRLKRGAHLLSTFSGKIELILYILTFSPRAPYRTVSYHTLHR